VKRILKIVIVVVLGGVSFAASFFIGQLTSGPPQAAQATSGQAGQTAAELTAPSDMSLPSGMTEPTIHMKERELDYLIKELRLKLEAVAAREMQVDKREKRLALAEKLLKQQADELENLRLQLIAPLTRLREEQAKLRNALVTISQQEEANLKRTAKIYERMDPEKGGEIFTSMCRNNQEQDVVKILYFMSDRMAAKVLAAIADTQLAARLCESLKKVTQRQEG